MQNDRKSLSKTLPPFKLADIIEAVASNVLPPSLKRSAISLEHSDEKDAFDLY